MAALLGVCFLKQTILVQQIVFVKPTEIKLENNMFPLTFFVHCGIHTRSHAYTPDRIHDFFV
jgi:hypothetical protein